LQKRDLSTKQKKKARGSNDPQGVKRTMKGDCRDQKPRIGVYLISGGSGGEKRRPAKKSSRGNWVGF